MNPENYHELYKIFLEKRPYLYMTIDFDNFHRNSSIPQLKYKYLKEVQIKGSVTTQALYSLIRYCKSLRSLDVSLSYITNIDYDN